MLSGNFVFLLPLSQLCAQRWDQEGWQRLFASTWSCTSELTLLRVDLTEDAVLFKVFAVLAVEGQPMSPQLVQLHRHFSFSGFLNCDQECTHGPCALLCPGQLHVLMQMNAVGWSVNIAVCSDGERMQAACRVLLIPRPCPLQAQLLLYHSW